MILGAVWNQAAIVKLQHKQNPAGEAPTGIFHLQLYFCQAFLFLLKLFSLFFSPEKRKEKEDEESNIASVRHPLALGAVSPGDAYIVQVLEERLGALAAGTYHVAYHGDGRSCPRRPVFPFALAATMSVYLGRVIRSSDSSTTFPSAAKSCKGPAMAGCMPGNCMSAIFINSTPLVQHGGQGAELLIYLVVGYLVAPRNELAAALYAPRVLKALHEFVKYVLPELCSKPHPKLPPCGCPACTGSFLWKSSRYATISSATLSR